MWQATLKARVSASISVVMLSVCTLNQTKSFIVHNASLTFNGSSSVVGP